jgi:predicted nucleic acid-binding protein
MVIVDSSVWIDYLNGTVNSQTEWLDRESLRQRIGLTDLILCEVLQGLRSDAQFRQVHGYLLNFQIFVAGSIHLATATAQNYRLLRKRGITVRKPIDCLIATFCIAEDHELLHRDRDFDAFAQHLGLKVVDPPAVSLN